MAMCIGRFYRFQFLIPILKIQFSASIWWCRADHLPDQTLFRPLMSCVSISPSEKNSDVIPSCRPLVTTVLLLAALLDRFHFVTGDPRAVLPDQGLTFDPNLPPELTLPPREISHVANVNHGFARQAPGTDVLGELHGLEQVFGSAPSVPPPAATSQAPPPPVSAAVPDRSAANLRVVSAAVQLPTSYSFRRDAFGQEARLSVVGAAARPRGQSRSGGRSEGRQQQQPRLDEVDLVMPRPPHYRTALWPGAADNITVTPLGRALGQSSTSCILQLKNRSVTPTPHILHGSAAQTKKKCVFIWDECMRWMRSSEPFGPTRKFLIRP